MTPTLVNVAITNIANSYTKDPNNQIDQKETSSVQNQFFKEFVFSIKKVLTYNVLMSPQVKMVMMMVDVVNNGSIAFTDTETQIKSRINILSCLLKGILNSLNEAIYDLVKTEILKLVSAAASLLSKEGIDKIRNILKSLI